MMWLSDVCCLMRVFGVVSLLIFCIWLKGVPGIGPKIAAALINEYGNLDALLENVDQIKQTKRRETLQAHISQAQLSRRLVDLDSNVPHPAMIGIPNNDAILSVREIRMEPINTKRLFAFYDEMGFKQLRRILEHKIKGAKLKRTPARNKRPKATIPQPEDFSDVPF
jgi:5'-3' exonuclease